MHEDKIQSRVENFLLKKGTYFHPFSLKQKVDIHIM